MAKNSKKCAFTKAKLEHFADQLESERNALVRQIRTLSAASVSSRQAGEELADVGSDDFIRETELAVMTEEGKRLALINVALENIENGTYGICIDCDKVISEGRLKAKPFARLCIDCKTLREQNDGIPQHSRDDYHELVE